MRVITAVLALSLLGGCASVGGDGAKRQGPGQRVDPWERWNRKVFAFNEDLDKHVLKPVATAYQKVVPELVRTGVDNFFTNAADGWSAVNHLLQGKWQSGFEMTVRFTTNTVFGFAGLLDIASEAGLESQPEDFGQTLGRWGFGAGAYIVWPVLGPSSVRDSVGLPLDLMASPATVINDGRSKVSITLLQLVNKRASLLGASRVLDDIALDKYSFVRDAYLARRRSLVYDGNPPDSKSDDEDKNKDQDLDKSKDQDLDKGKEQDKQPAAEPAAPASAASGAAK